MYLRQLLLGRELEGDRPLRGLRRDAEQRTQRDVVELDDDAVRVYRMLEAPRLPLVEIGVYIVERIAEPFAPLRRQAELREPFEHSLLRRDAVLFGRNHLIEVNLQVAPRRLLRVERAQAARRGVARVREERLAVFLARGVESREALFVDADLAAHLERSFDRLREAQRHRPYRLEVRPFLSMQTSPRTSSVPSTACARRSGIVLIVLRFAVTSSPI